MAVAILMTACQPPQVRYYPLNNPVGEGQTAAADAAPLAPTNPAEVKIYVTGPPSRPYDQMGILTLRTSSSQPNEGAIYQRFREKAAEIGADGVVLLPSREQNESFWQTTGYPYSYYYGFGGTASGYSIDSTTFRGLAIKFR
ncbi:MAG: hypothetical protein AAGF10_01750 [Verrucomicrobiota bacterium]